MSVFNALRVNRVRRPMFAAFLAVFLLLFPARSVFLGAQTGYDGGLGLSVEAEPVLGKAGSIWTVTILVRHPDPAEVRVKAPALPSSLRLERTRIQPRLSGGVRQTVVEYDFLVLREAGFTLGSFELTVPGKRGLTRPFTVSAAGPRTPDDTPLPRLFWAAPPDALRIGEAAEIALHYEYPPGASLSAETRSQSAASWSYRPALPVNAILEVLPGPPLPGLMSDPGQGETGILLRLHVIPLEGRLLSLQETSITLDGRLLAVPSLELRIRAR